MWTSSFGQKNAAITIAIQNYIKLVIVKSFKQSRKKMVNFYNENFNHFSNTSQVCVIQAEKHKYAVIL